MFTKLSEAFARWKSKRMLKRAVDILSRLNYEIVDLDDSSGMAAFKFVKDSIGLFVSDPSTLGSRIEATILFPADLGNLKLMSDLANIAMTYRCSLSGMIHSGSQKAKVELAFYLGEKFNRRSIALALTYLQQCITSLTDRIMNKIGATQIYKFDLSMFEGDDIPFFDPKLIGERRDFMYGDWDQYIQASANKKALEAYTAVDIDHNLEIVLACREFEQSNNCSLSEVGDVVMMELARHRNNQLAPEDKKRIQ